MVLPCHAMSLLHILQLTHFFCLFSVKCSHALDDLGRTDFSASAMYLSSTSARFFLFLLCPVYEAPNSASISARERPSVFTPLCAQLKVFFFFFFFFLIKNYHVLGSLDYVLLPRHLVLFPPLFLNAFCP